MTNNDGPTITTIIPTYKRPQRLKKAIRSVLNQTYPHFQLCIYDNASGDSTASVVEEFAKKDPRIKYHCHSENIGAIANFQYGLEKVETPFFSFLSDDDFLLPEFYETALAGFKKYPDAAFSAGAVIDVNDREEVIDSALLKWPDKEYFTPPDGLIDIIGKYSNWIGMLFRKEIVEKVGPLDLGLKAIDVDYVFRVAAHFPFTITKKPCAVFVQHASSYSGGNGLKLIFPGWPLMISKIEQNRQLPIEIQLKAVQRLQADYRNLLFMNALRSLEKMHFEEAQLIVNIYKEQGEKNGKGVLLETSIKMCQALPIVQKLLVLMLKMRRFWLRRLKRAYMQKEYRKWASSL